MTGSQSVRFLIISDTHTAELAAPSSKLCAFRQPMPKADVLLHCGDLTMVGGLDEYKATIRMLSSIDAELKLVVAGNHDLSLDAEYLHRGLSPDEEKELQQQARSIWTGEEARAAGVTYLDEGLYRFELKSGAHFSLYASPYTPEFCGWAFPYFRDEDRFNPEDHAADQRTKNIAIHPIPTFPEVDIVMTHGPPQHHLGKTITGTDAGCESLLHALRRSRPRLHCFGHIHEGWGAKILEWQGDDQTQDQTIWSRTTKSISNGEGNHDQPERIDVTQSSSIPVMHGKHTLLVNAAIMDLSYKPTNPPWLVDMDLPTST